MKKRNLVALFGGQSSEHAVSCMSVQNVAADLDVEKYNVILVGITEDGHWLKVASIDEIKDGSWQKNGVPAILSPDAKEQCLLVTEIGRTERIAVDVVFPVLHGLYGEDGTVQGLLELARIPYVGCGVLASAVSMDKLMTKQIVKELGIRQASYVPVFKENLSDMDRVIAGIEAKFAYPVFIKPSNSGSSRGVTKAGSREVLKAGLLEAAKHDRRMLVEEAISGHEVECAVYGGGQEETKASGVGEILAGAEFYDYDAKYHSEESQTVIDPALPGDSVQRIREAAVRIFEAVDGYGIARVDFFVTKSGEVVFNEINTMPGFTAISMYPQLWKACGMDIVNALVEHALKRYER